MHRFTLLVGLLASPAVARSPAEVAAPFIDEHTLVVARVDLTRVDVATVLTISQAVLGNDEDVAHAAAEVRAFVQEFARRGGTDVYLSYGSADFPNLPTLIIPAPKDEAGRRSLAQLFVDVYKRSGQEADSVVLHECVCVGPKPALTVVKARKPVDRPDLAAALQAGRDGAAQAAFAMSADAKKIFEQVAPTLPAELGGGSVQMVTRGMKWTALVIGPGPKMPAKWIIEAAGPEAAQDLRAIQQRLQQLATTAVREMQRAAGAGDRPATGPFDQARTTTTDGRVVTTWDLAPSLLAALRPVDGLPADRARSMNNLKQLMLALHNYHAAFGRFPADVTDKGGKPLLSWRVQILPFIEQEALYKEFKFDEPWDSSHNQKLIARMPKVFRSPRQAAAVQDRTTYLAPLGTGLMWDNPKGLKISEVTDGTSNTIALVEADDDRAVTWTKPEDISIDRKNPTAGLLGHFGTGFLAAMADGSVRFFGKDIDPMKLSALFTRAGGEVVGSPK